MSTSNYEFRVFIIGDYQVGKSSIVKRFKKLNSTQTEEDNFFIPGNPKTEFGLDQIKTKEAQEKYDKYQQLDVMDKALIRKQIERKNLMKFKKIFIVGKCRLEFNFFPIKSAEEKIMTGLNDLRDEEEEVKFGNKLINFKSIQEEIKNILTKEQKDPSATLDNLFLFVYDLKDYSTLKKLELYYNKLNNYFKIDSDYLKALIGNKADSKISPPKKDKDFLDAFMKNNNFKYYEISTYNYFNFETFFESIFIDILSSIEEELQKKAFINRFHLILHSRPTLSKAERKIHRINDVPFLAEGENPDVYAYPEDKAEFRRTFSNMKKGRYGFKIFINKQGPIFPVVDKHGTDKNKHGGYMSKPGTAYGRDKKSKTAIGFGNWEINNRNKEIREALQMNVPGYSLGIKGGKYGFRQERKKKFQEREEELKSAFQGRYTNLNQRKTMSSKYKKNIDYDENKKEIMKQIVDRIQENENRHVKDREKNIEMRENLIKEKIDKIKTKQEKYQKIYEKNQQEIMLKRQEMSHPKTALTRKAKSKPKDIPNYTLYDVTTKYDPNKGWSMGMKYTYNPNKNKDDPDFPKLQSEFDKIVNNPKYAEIKYTAPRFKEEKIVKPSTDIKPYDDSKEKKKIKEIREKSERNMKIKKFLANQEKNKQKVKENKKQILEAQQEELEELKERIAPKNQEGLYDYTGYNGDYVDINYKLVEEASPNYTMKGRYNHGSIFDMPDNYSLVNNEDDDEENKIGSNGKPIQDEEYKKSLPVPQYNIVKPSLPTYSFSKATRFYSKPLYQPSPNAIPVIPFEDGKFKPDDVKSFFQGKEGMVKAKKDNVLKSNGIPGPGQYKIKGFAEILAEKGKKISDRRDEIRKKERDLEMRKIENIEEEKNLEKNLDINKDINRESVHENKDLNLNKLEMKLEDDDDEDENDNNNKNQ